MVTKWEHLEAPVFRCEEFSAQGQQEVGHGWSTWESAPKAKLPVPQRSQETSALNNASSEEGAQDGLNWGL